MFVWLKNLLRKWVGQEDLSVYMPKERKIFTYWNGEKLIKDDPMTLYYRMLEVGPTLFIDLQVAMMPMNDSKDSHEKALVKMRSIFNVKKLTPDQPGLGDIELFDLFNQFSNYINDLKKNAKVTSTRAEETLVPTKPSSPGSLPILNTSPSGSTVNVPSSEKSKPTDLPSPLPTVPTPPNLNTSAT